MDGFSRIIQMPVLVRRQPSALPTPREPPAPAARRRPGSSGPSRPVQVIRGLSRPVAPWLMGLIAALVSFAVLLTGLATPALWGDEAVTAVAIRRSWPALWQLMQGSEAPLVPYYAVLKAASELSEWVVPASAGHVEALVRWPSAVALAAACGLVVGWLARAGSRTLSVCVLSALLLITGVSRYGQEARPYAMVLLMAVLATALWWKAMNSSSFLLSLRWLPLYALAVAGLIALHTLAASLLLAHAISAFAWRDPASTGVLDRFLRKLLRGTATLLAGAAGAALASPLTVRAIRNGTGASTMLSSDPSSDMVQLFLRLFTTAARPGPAVVVLLVAVLILLPVAAIAGCCRTGEQQNLVRLGLAWGVAPLLVLVPAALSRPNLWATRYLLFLVPGWALLAGLGLVMIATAVRRLLPYADGRLVTALVVVAAIAGGVLVQAPSLASVRSRTGHGEDVRAVLALASRAQYRELPIQVLPPEEAIQVSAYSPALADRVVNSRLGITGAAIFPQRQDGDVVTSGLRSAPGLIVLTRGSISPKVPRDWPGCTIEASGASDRKWSYYVLRPASADHCTF